ncbi:MAG: DUF5906 domain-containing protein [Methanotrichaceae archaeon]|jgi:phage/plasmid-associated DNA primase
MKTQHFPIDPRRSKWQQAFQDPENSPGQQDNPCLSTNDSIVKVRRECAAFLLRIHDKLTEDELASINMAYVEAHGDFKTEADYQSARLINQKYNVPDLTRGDVVDIELKCRRDGEEYEKITFNHYRAANAVIENLPVVMSEDGELYYWHGQIWQPNAEDVIYNKIKGLAKKAYNTYQHREVIAAIKHALTFKRIKLDSDPYLLGVKNGVVELATGTFRPYNKEDLITEQIDVLYDPKAKCPVFFRYLETSIPRIIDRFTAIDWIALHAIKQMFPYVMFLLGRGRNGKGLFEDLLRAVYGMNAFSGVTFEELKESQFAGMGLFRKRGQIVGEGGKERGEGKKTLPTLYMKNATGGGVIDTDRKGKDRFAFLPYYKATIDSNEMPYIEDSTVGMQERFCKIDMPYAFVDNRKKALTRDRKTRS